MRRLHIALLLVPLAAGCAKQEVVPPVAREPAFDSVEMHRSGCYGVCPVYTVHIGSDGTVAYEGEQFVNALGQRKRTVSGSALLQLSDAIEKAKFSTLKEQYTSVLDCNEWSTDSPTVDIIVRVGTYQHHVSYYYGCTISVGQAIDDLSKAIDTAAGTAEWVSGRAF